MPTSTPQQLGYRMPAEWESHEATWLAWPHNPDDWPGKFQAIPWLYAEIVRLLAIRERVHLLVQDEKAQRRASSVLKRSHANLDSVSFHQWPTDRVWTRDSGPIFVRNPQGQVAVTNWRFNAWAKYPDWHLDDQIPGRAAELLNLPRMAACCRSRRRRAPTGSRRWFDRHQWTGNPAHHRRVSAERSPAAQPRREPRAA